MFKNFLDKFLRDNCGASAVEFALIAPVLVIGFLGVVAATQSHETDQDLQLGVATIADLVSQENRLTVAQLEDIVIGAREVIGERGDDVDIRIVSLSVASDGTRVIDWVHESRSQSVGSAALPKVSPGDFGVSARDIGSNDSMIIAEGELPYDELFGGKRTLEIQIDRRPRNDTRVFLCDIGGVCK